MDNFKGQNLKEIYCIKSLSFWVMSFYNIYKTPLFATTKIINLFSILKTLLIYPQCKKILKTPHNEISKLICQPGISSECNILDFSPLATYLLRWTNLKSQSSLISWAEHLMSYIHIIFIVRKVFVIVTICLCLCPDTSQLLKPSIQAPICKE